MSLLVPATTASADEIGPLYPGIGEDLGGVWYPWLNPENIDADDNLFTEAHFDAGNSNYLQATAYGFEIPTGAVIEGIQVTVSRYSTEGAVENVRDLDVFLLKNGEQTGINHAYPYHLVDWPTIETPITYGEPADLWGETWTPEDINAANFGVLFKANSWGTNTGFIDYIRITITFTYNGTTISTSAVSGTYGDTVDLSATLSPAMSGKSIQFQLGGAFACSGITNASGYATCSATLKANAGMDPVGLRASFAGDPPFGTSTATASLTVARRPITVTSVSSTKTYDGTTSSSGLPSITTGSLASGDTVSWSQTFFDRNAGNNKTIIPSGTVTDGNNGNNYDIDFIPNNSGRIDKLGISVSAVSEIKVYNGTRESSLLPTISPELGANDTATFTQRFDNRNVGTDKVITASGTINDGNSGNNYTVVFLPSTGTITKRAVTVTAVTQTKVYDGTPDSTGSPTISPTLGAGDTGSFSQVFADEHAGALKTILPSATIEDGNSGNNYTVKFVTVTGTISPRGITVTADPKTRPYGSQDPQLTYQFAPALISGDTFTGSLMRQAGNNAGVYPILQGTLSAGTDYTIAYVGANFTITKLNQTITVESSAPDYAESGKTFTVAAESSSGLVIAYSASGGCTNIGATFTMMSSSMNCVVHYNQSGNTNYNPASEITEIVSAMELPVITMQPTNVLVYPGRDATFTTSARGFPQPTVQWQVSYDGGMTFEDLAGEASPDLTIPLPSQSLNNNLYRAIYTNIHGSKETNPASLTLLYNQQFIPLIMKK